MVRTVFVVVAPAGILIIGLWLVGVAAFVLAANPFEPNWIVMMGGIAVVVAMALVAIIIVDRPGNASEGHKPPPTEH